MELTPHTASILLLRKSGRIPFVRMNGAVHVDPEPDPNAANRIDALIEKDSLQPVIETTQARINDGLDSGHLLIGNNEVLICGNGRTDHIRPTETARRGTIHNLQRLFPRGTEIRNSHI